jgi:chromosome segregation ATPase
VKVNSQPVHDTSDFTHAVRSRNGNGYNIGVIRDKKEQNLNLTLPERRDSGDMLENESIYDQPSFDADNAVELSELHSKIAELQPQIALARQEAIESSREVIESSRKAMEEVRKSLCDEQKKLRQETEKQREEMRKQQEQLKKELEQMSREIRRGLEI